MNEIVARLFDGFVIAGNPANQKSRERPTADERTTAAGKIA